MDRAPDRRAPAQCGKLRAALIARLIGSVSTLTELQRDKVLFAEKFVDVPDTVAHLWAWFWQLDQARQYGDLPQALAWQEVAAWAGLHGISPRQWELQAIMSMDFARRAALAAATSEPQESLNQVDMNDPAAVQALLKSCAPKN